MAYTTIDDPSAHFQTKIYSGQNSQLAVTNGANSNLKPDWLWIKSRNDSDIHHITNSTLGPDLYVKTNDNAAEVSSTGHTESFDTDGFTVNGPNDVVNTNGGLYVAWQWKANGGTTASNSDGNVTSTVQANTTAGFSIVTYTGTGSTSSTVGHGLGVEPDIIIFKRRDGVGNWDVQHNDGASGPISVAFRHTLNLTEGTATNVLSSFSSTTFGLGSATSNEKNANGSPYVAYAFKGKQGYSKFGTYYGNGSTDGKFVYLGFKPSLVIFKVLSDPNYGWSMMDTKRSPFNLMNNNLYANTIAPDATDANKCDFLSNGFKLRGSTYPANAGGTNTFAYFAWAENPFVTSTGTPTTAK